MHELISSVKNFNYNIYGGYVPELLRPLLHHIYIQSSIVNSALCKHFSKRNDNSKQKENVICFDIGVFFLFLFFEIEDQRKKIRFSLHKKGRFSLSYSIWIVWLAPNVHSSKIWPLFTTLMLTHISCNCYGDDVVSLYFLQLNWNGCCCCLCCHSILSVCRVGCLTSNGKAKKLVSPKRHQRR